MKINQRLSEIEKELVEENIKPKQLKALKAEQDSLTEEKTKLEAEGQNGWVLLDFPSSYAQAKLLEEALSGYKPDQELDPVQRDIEMEMQNEQMQKKRETEKERGRGRGVG